MNKYRQILVTGLLLMVFAVIGSAVVSITYDATKEKIAENQRRQMLKSLHQIMPPERYNNDLLKSKIKIPADDRLGPISENYAYVARKDGKIIGFIFSPLAPDGYSGEIKLLVGVYVDGTLSGIRVVSHNETPGLGDAVDASRSDWIYNFSGKSLNNPKTENWKVKRDGGYFDQFTGATITPRAVVKAVKLTLIYFDRHKKYLLGEIDHE